jgi:hypothetical protein
MTAHPTSARPFNPHLCAGSAPLRSALEEIMKQLGGYEDFYKLRKRKRRPDDLIEITANELKAAEKYGEGYELYLVARCISDTPVYQVITNPAKNLETGNWLIEPTSFRVSFVS